MEVRIINPFVHGTVEAMKKIAFLDIHPGKAYPHAAVAAHLQSVGSLPRPTGHPPIPESRGIGEVRRDARGMGPNPLSVAPMVGAPGP